MEHRKLNVIDYSRIQDIKYPFGNNNDTHGRMLRIKFEVTYMSDGDPFNPKFNTITVGGYSYRDGESNQHLTTDEILQSIANLFGTKWTSVVAHIKKFPSEGYNARAEESLRVDMSAYTIRDPANEK